VILEVPGSLKVPDVNYDPLHYILPGALLFYSLNHGKENALAYPLRPLPPLLFRLIPLHGLKALPHHTGEEEVRGIVIVIFEAYSNVAAVGGRAGVLYWRDLIFRILEHHSLPPLPAQAEHYMPDLLRRYILLKLAQKSGGFESELLRQLMSLMHARCPLAILLCHIKEIEVYAVGGIDLLGHIGIFRPHHLTA